MVRTIKHTLDKLCEYPNRLARLNSLIMKHVIRVAHLMDVLSIRMTTLFVSYVTNGQEVTGNVHN